MTPVDVNFANTVQVNINWSFPDNAYPYTTSDILTYELPEGISANYTGDLMDGSTKEGTFTVSGRTVTIQYTSESFLTESTRKGSLALQGTFTDKVIHGGEGGTTNLEFPGVGTITIDMHRDTSNDSISVNKSGGKVYKGTDGNLYADYLVEIASKGENTNVIFSDKMGEYLTLTGNVQFYTDSACTSAYTGAVNETTVPDKSFAYSISTMTNGETIYAKYTALVNKAITYNFNDWNKKLNEAFVKSDEHTNENQGWVDAKISEDLKYPTITKDGRKESDGLITWTIQFGKEGFDISGMKLKDILKDVNDGQYLASTFKEGTFIVSPSVDGLDYDKLTSDAGFIMPNGSTGIYTITYQTTYIQPVGIIQEYKVNNKVSEYPDGSTEYSSANKDVVVGEKNTDITKDCLTTTNSKEVQWKITVNVPESGMENLKVEDTIPAGMTYLDDSVELLSAGYTNPAVSKEGNKITFTFGAATKGAISFTYKTNITTLPDVDTTYTNVAELYEKETKYGEDDATYKYVFKQYLSKGTDWNTFKVEGNDVSTSIPWVLTVSKLPEGAKNVVITDTLPSNLKMVDNSLMIKENWSKDIASSNINVEITKTSTGNVINFKLSDSLIKLAKSKDIQILFNTTYEDLSKVPSGNIEYKNTAQIKVNDYTAPAVSASRWKEYNSKDILNKDGIYNDGETFIHYTISVNKSSADLNPTANTLTLEDTMGSEIDFQMGTLKINGVTATAEQYSYDYSQRKLTISIPDNKYVTITYDGYPNLAVGEKFTGNSNNHVVLKGTQKEIAADKSFANVEVHQSAGTSSSNGVSLSIYKQEKGVTAKPLQGAEFELCTVTCDASGREISAEDIHKTKKTTAADGYTRFTGLNRSVLYKLVETKAPNHYELDTTPIYVLFKSKTDTTEPIRTVISGEREYPVDILEGNTSTYQKIVENKPLSESGSIKVTKSVEGLAAGTNGPDSIEFTVTKDGDGSFAARTLTVTRKEDGSYTEATADKLPLGTYTVTENDADVAGYTVVTTYKVGETETNSVTLSKEVSDQTVAVTNTYAKDVGSLTFTKTFAGAELTEEQTAGINFTVTGPDEYSQTFALSDIHNEDGSYSKTLENLPVGKYTVTENDADVAGYTVVTTYKVGETETNSVTLSKEVSNQTVTVTNNYTQLVSYIVKKEWNLNGTEGVVVPETIKVQLTANGIDYGDQVELHASENWTYTWDNLPKSDAVGKINYSVREIEAPKGYTVSAVTDTESRVITLTNTYTNGKEVTFSKEDVAGNELPGATMSISVKNGEEVSRWVSTSEKNVVTLAPGNYTLTELTAPDGYLKAQSIDFTLDAEGKVSVDGNPVSEVVMVDEYASHDVVISKVDAANNKELAGAVLKVTDKEGNEVDKWTSEEGKNHTVTVKPGRYTFTEVSAPKGYELAESITFNVDLNGKVTIDGKEVTAVVMKDAKKPTNVQTGVHTNVGGFGALGGFSIGMAFIVLFLRKKMD